MTRLFDEGLMHWKATNLSPYVRRSSCWKHPGTLGIHIAPDASALDKPSSSSPSSSMWLQRDGGTWGYTLYIIYPNIFTPYTLRRDEGTWGSFVTHLI